MLFTSYSFLFVFLPIFLLAYFASPARYRPIAILVGSYLFYAFWRLDFCLLLLAVTSIGFFGGRWIEEAVSKSGKRSALVLSTTLACLLAILGWFKYAGFFGDTWNAAVGYLGAGSLALPVPEILLPVGISFFTFQTVSYVVDVSRGGKVCRSFASFAAYVALFPQLVAGPIVRFSDVANEIARPKVSSAGLHAGAILFMVGFCKKVWIANNVAGAADWGFALESPALTSAWLGVSAYTLQIYFDFSGYSEMAIGLGLMMGFRFPENFLNPYLARNISEFWHRWHITMSRFFRDYLYIPLGGNRRGAARTIVNLGITMLLAGLWHGAGWTFVLWGLFHGALLALHRIWSQFAGERETVLLRCIGWVSIPLTLVAVMVGWALFRAESLSGALTMLCGMVGRNGVHDAVLLAGQFDKVLYMVAVVGVAIVAFEPYLRRKVESSSVAQFVLFLCFLGAIHELGAQEYNPFLYFQF